MRAVLFVLCAVFIRGAHAADSKTIDFNFKDAEIAKVLSEYSHASGQKFILDPAVKGHVTILNPGPVTLDEAFNQLSTALALNSLGVSKQNDQMVVMQARAL